MGGEPYGKRNWERDSWRPAESLSKDRFWLTTCNSVNLKSARESKSRKKVVKSGRKGPSEKLQSLGLAGASTMKKPIELGCKKKHVSQKVRKHQVGGYSLQKHLQGKESAVAEPRTPLSCSNNS